MYQDIHSREIFCTVCNDRQAAEIVRLLKTARFSCDEISIFFPSTGDHQAPSEETRKELCAAVRAAPRHLATSLIRMGMPEFESARFAARLACGQILVAVHAESDADVDRVCEALDDAAAEGIVIVPRFKATAAPMAEVESDFHGLRLYSAVAG